MYFVDRKKMEKTLSYIEDCLVLFKETNDWSTQLSKLGLERIAHVTIEAIIDVGNQLIDGFIMRDPGSYEDIIDILTDERVIDIQQQDDLKEIIIYRKKLVQAYTEIDHKELQKLLDTHYTVLERFPNQVREYVEKELGPVSAFLPEE